jgi:Na+-translocating ferredoxin:NAD+ oxidoreductase RnfG subunit
MHNLNIKKIIAQTTALVLLLLLFSTSCSVRENTMYEVGRKVFPLGKEIREVRLADDLSNNNRLFTIEDSSAIIGYLLEKEVRGRSGPFTIMVLIDANFKVKHAAVLEYPHERGRDVRSRKFTRQFNGKGPRDPIRLDQDIVAVTGATISSRAMTNGVREAVELVQQKNR